jgi:tight adherence protein C
VTPVPLPVLLLVLLLGLSMVVRRRRPTRQRLAVQRIQAGELPALLDLLRVLLDAGVSAPQAFAALAVYGPASLCVPCAAVGERVRRGHLFADALDGFVADVGRAALPLVGALQAANRYGTGVASALDSIAVELRLLRQRQLEEATRRLPVLLLFPLICCILPAFALLTIVPLLGGGLSALRW